MIIITYRGEYGLKFKLLKLSMKIFKGSLKLSMKFFKGSLKLSLKSFKESLKYEKF